MALDLRRAMGACQSPPPGGSRSRVVFLRSLMQGFGICGLESSVAHLLPLPLDAHGKPLRDTS